MQRQFWSFASREAMEFVNQNAPMGTRVDFQDATTGTCDMLKDEGFMRHDLQCASRIHAPSILLFDVDERFSEEEQRYWQQMGTVGPMHEVSVDGVPLVRIYVKGGGLRWLENQTPTAREGPAQPRPLARGQLTREFP
jgi:hypothetical protein